MPKHIKINVGNESAYLEKLDNATWSKQLTAPGMPGDYSISLEIEGLDGNKISYESSQSVIVTRKIFDLGQYGKLSEKLIKRIVLTLSSYASHVLLEGSTIRVLVRMDSDNVLLLESIKKVLLPKIPAHLNLLVERYSGHTGDYAIGNEIKTGFSTWGDVKKRVGSWGDLLIYAPVEPLKEGF